MAAVQAARCLRLFARSLQCARSCQLTRYPARITSYRSFNLSSYLASVKKFTEDHEWILVDEGVGTVGVTDHAQAELGDIVYCELPEDGAEFAKGDTFGSIESVKATSDLFCPVSGSIVEANTSLTDSPERINEDPYGEGWLIKLRLKDEAELDELMDEAAYEAFLKEAEH